MGYIVRGEATRVPIAIAHHLKKEVMAGARDGIAGGRRARRRLPRVVDSRCTRRKKARRAGSMRRAFHTLITRTTEC